MKSLSRRLILISLLGWLLPSISLSDIGSDIRFILKKNPTDDPTIISSNNFFSKETSELKILAMSAIQFYQIFISSQDQPVCMFTPSCSHFGMESFKEYGFFWGFLMTMDRLLRCNGIGRKYYDTDPKTGLAIDPIHRYQSRVGSSNTENDKK